MAGFASPASAWDARDGGHSQVERTFIAHSGQLRRNDLDNMIQFTTIAVAITAQQRILRRDRLLNVETSSRSRHSPFLDEVSELLEGTRRPRRPAHRPQFWTIRALTGETVIRPSSGPFQVERP
jgi:hypothetical protein